MAGTSLRRFLATSDGALPRLVRRLYHGVYRFSLPVPRAAVKPFLWTFILVRSVAHGLMRVFICEPFFRAYCTTCGRGLRTGTFIHWIQGKGDIIVGDNVWVNGKSSIAFAHRYSDRPTLRIGDNTAIGHQCSFVIGKAITIGKRCLLSGNIMVFDSSGHSTDPAARRSGQPPLAEDVREVVIGDDVWIGVRCVICPGVRIGNGAVLSAGSVVHSHVPPGAVVAGNPARVLFRQRPPPAGPAADGARAPWMGA